MAMRITTDHEFKLCRLCLCTGRSLMDIFSRSCIMDFSVEETILDLLAFRAVHSPDFPWLVCSTCMHKLSEFRLFKQQCLECKMTFESRFMGMESRIKEEEVCLKEKTTAEDPEHLMSEISDEALPTILHTNFIEGNYSNSVHYRRREDDGEEDQDTDVINNNETNVYLYRRERAKELSKERSRRYREKRKREIVRTQDGKQKDKHKETNEEIIEKRRLRRNELSRGYNKQYRNKMRARKERQVFLGEDDAEDDEYLAGEIPDETEDDPSPKISQLESIEPAHPPPCDMDGSSLRNMGAEENGFCDRAEYTCSNCGFKCCDTIELRVHTCGINVNRRNLLGKSPEENSSHEESSLKWTKVGGVSKPFKCEMCAKAFTQKSALVRHLSLHSGLRPFQCEMCGKNFTRKCHLVQHMTVHSGLRAYDCESCGKRFAQKSSLVRHFAGHVPKPFKLKTWEGTGFKSVI